MDLIPRVDVVTILLCIICSKEKRTDKFLDYFIERCDVFLDSHLKDLDRKQIDYRRHYFWSILVLSSVIVSSSSEFFDLEMIQ